MRRWALMLAMVLLTASGCGKVSLEEVGQVLDAIDDLQDGGNNAPEAVALFADAAKASAGLAVRGTVTLQMPSDEDTAQQWVSQFESGTDGALSMTVPPPPGTVDASLTSVGGESELRYVAGTTYVRMPKTEVATRGVDVAGVEGEWVWLTATTQAVEDMDPGYPLMMLCSITAEAGLPCAPLSAVGAITGIARNARIIGSEEVRGTATTRVTFTLPMLPMDDENGDSAGEGAGLDGEDGSLSDLLSGLASGGVEAETWVGSDKLIRRFSVDFTAMLFSVDFQDFGADISVVAPPAELVVGDFSSLLPATPVLRVN